jgi:DNA repair protein RecN (Recombination protein N)
VIREIRIRDLGVIEEAVVELAEGLTVLSGETGAGKTMVVQALGLLAGARADSGLVRTGARQAVVEAIIDLPAGHPALARAVEAGGDVEDGLVLVRTVSAEGRSRAHVGGRSAPVGVLSEIAEHLVAVHGQADQWRLRHADEHRDLVDRHGGRALLEAREAHRTAFDEHRAAVHELAALQEAARDRARELEVLELGLRHLEEVDPQPGEDVALREESMRLSHADALRAAVGAAQALLTGGDDDRGEAWPVVDALARAQRELERGAEADPALGGPASRLGELATLVNDLVVDLSAYAADLDLDPARLEWVEQRRAALADLVRKYGEDVEAVLGWGRAAAARVAELQGSDDRIEELRARVADLAQALDGHAERLSRHRRDAAAALARAVTDELGSLAMGSAAVTVEVAARSTPTRDGRDDVEIRLAANPGTPGRSVTRAASGGELSRVMLAIEVATRGDGDTRPPTFVFDEVDAGVGGRAALAVGSRLAALGRGAQVVVVSHLPQVAAHADRHLVVSKATDGRITASGVHEVTGADRESELARMMTGVDSQTARAHSRELLAEAASTHS